MMNANSTSLLVTEDEGSGVPALGGPATHLESEDYQSPLERLIAHSTSEQRGDPLSAPNNDDNEPPLPERMVLWSPISSSSRTAALPTTNPSLVTLVAGTCCLLQMGLVWASFLAPSWLETRLYLSISLPSVKVETPESQLLHTTTLGSLVGDLLGAGKHWAAMALVLTSLVLPCVGAVSAAVWIVEDRQEENLLAASVDECSLRRHPNRPKTCSHPRLIVECFARIGFSIFFVLCILVLGSSPLEIEFNDSRFVVVNQMKGGLSSYALGMIFGLLVLALLRFGRTNLQEFFQSSADSNRTTETRRRRDLECSWRVRSNDLFTGMAGRHASKAEAEAEEELRTPLIQDETNNDRDTASVETEQGGLSLWKRILLYELGLTSTLLWIPALFLPLFHLKYEGIISDFMSEAELSFRLKDFPVELWERGVSAGTNRFLLVVLDSVFMLLVFVFPAMASLTAIGTWLLDTKASEVCKRLLWILQPLLGALVFGTALYVSIPAFGTVTESVMNNVSSGLCSNFEAIAGDACFTIEAEPSTGLWFLLGEALALELFVVLTLRWHSN